MKILKKEYFTLITNNNFKLFNNYNSNKFILILKNKFNEIYNYDVDHRLPNLHRWCNNTSTRYKKTCDWEKKLENAVQDNCLGNYK